MWGRGLRDSIWSISQIIHRKWVDNNFVQGRKLQYASMTKHLPWKKWFRRANFFLNKSTDTKRCTTPALSNILKLHDNKSLALAKHYCSGIWLIGKDTGEGSYLSGFESYSYDPLDCSRLVSFALTEKAFFLLSWLFCSSRSPPKVIDTTSKKLE